MFNKIITFLKKIYSMLDSICSILEKSFTAEGAENAVFVFDGKCSF
jgi:hypothetical protein